MHKLQQVLQLKTMVIRDVTLQSQLQSSHLFPQSPLCQFCQLFGVLLSFHQSVQHLTPRDPEHITSY